MKTDCANQTDGTKIGFFQQSLVAEYIFSTVKAQHCTVKCEVFGPGADNEHH